MKKKTHPPGHKPGDVILDRYMIGATEEEREAARENLRQYAAVVLRIATRLATEEWEAEKSRDAGTESPGEEMKS